MRIVKRHLPRVKVPEWPSWRKIPQDAPRTPTQTETLLGQPLPSSPCCENLNGPTTEHNMGSTPGNWAGGLHFIFHALSTWFLRRAFSSPFILLIFWMFCKRKAPWQLKQGRLHDSLNYPALASQREKEASETFCILACWPDALDEAGAWGPSYNPFPASLAEVAVRLKQLIKRSIKAERKWGRNKLALNLKAVYANEVQYGLGGSLGSQS